MNSQLRILHRLAPCLGILNLLLVGGCTVGPDYHPPQTKMPSGWIAPTTAQEAQTAQWWTTFDDPTLNSLVTRALEGNLDLKQAQSRLREARAARGLVWAGLGPEAVFLTGTGMAGLGALVTAGLVREPRAKPSGGQ